MFELAHHASPSEAHHSDRQTVGWPRIAVRIVYDIAEARHELDKVVLDNQRNDHVLAPRHIPHRHQRRHTYVGNEGKVLNWTIDGTGMPKREEHKLLTAEQKVALAKVFLGTSDMRNGLSSSLRASHLLSGD